MALTLNDKLIIATEENNLRKLKKLLSNGADINYQDKNRQATALHRACYYNLTDIIKFLVDAGANVNLLDKYYMTPLTYATTTDNIKIIKLLIDNGSNLDNKDGFGLIFLEHRKENLTQWIKNYENQKYLIDKCGDMFKYIKKLNGLDDKIIEEYQHLEVGYNLGLLNI